MGADKQKPDQPVSIYPEATRGVLAGDQTIIESPKRPRRHFFDQGPAATIFSVSAVVVLFGIFGFTAFYQAIKKHNRVEPKEAALLIAKKVSEMQNGSVGRIDAGYIDEKFRTCQTTPRLVVTHEYKHDTRPTEHTEIPLGENVDISSSLLTIVERSDQAELNTLDIMCI